MKTRPPRTRSPEEKQEYADMCARDRTVLHMILVSEVIAKHANMVDSKIHATLDGDTVCVGSASDLIAIGPAKGATMQQLEHYAALAMEQIRQAESVPGSPGTRALNAVRADIEKLLDTPNMRNTITRICFELAAEQAVN